MSAACNWILRTATGLWYDRGLNPQIACCGDIYDLVYTSRVEEEGQTVYSPAIIKSASAQ